MKKLYTAAVLFIAGAFLFAASYTDNTYQKLAEEYTKQAEAALDAGQYAESVDLAQKAAENAELSKAYIDMMKKRKTADDEMANAQKKISWAQSIDADKNFPMAFTAAKDKYASAQSAYGSEDYDGAADYAKQAVAALDGVRVVTPLPEFYIVRPWAETKDCFWNISGRPYIYNNPLLWENLYQANKTNIPHPEDPNLILPGMKMQIPSITGENREGVYDPSKDYDPYDATR
jgi:tetratricopeptide (TPR) repeat protein